MQWCRKNGTQSGPICRVLISIRANKAYTTHEVLFYLVDSALQQMKYDRSPLIILLLLEYVLWYLYESSVEPKELALTKIHSECFLVYIVPKKYR